MCAREFLDEMFASVNKRHTDLVVEGAADAEEEEDEGFLSEDDTKSKSADP